MLYKPGKVLGRSHSMYSPWCTSAQLWFVSRRQHEQTAPSPSPPCSCSSGWRTQVRCFGESWGGSCRSCPPCVLQERLGCRRPVASTTAKDCSRTRRRSFAENDRDSHKTPVKPKIYSPTLSKIRLMSDRCTVSIPWVRVAWQRETVAVLLCGRLWDEV